MLPTPVESLRCFLMMLNAAGLRPDDFVPMVRNNPMQLFSVV
jgi:hypothetical protein